MNAEKNNAAGELFGQLTEYLALRARIIRLQVINQVAAKSASVIAFFIFFIFIIIIFGLLTISAGFFLASVFGSPALGFVVLGAIYALVLLILIVFREALIKKPLRNTIIRSLMKS
jgi:hypothetical protein